VVLRAVALTRSGYQRFGSRSAPTIISVKLDNCPLADSPSEAVFYERKHRACCQFLGEGFPRLGLGWAELCLPMANLFLSISRDFSASRAMHRLRVPPAKIVPPSASERQSGWVLGVVPREKSVRRHLNIPLAAEPWSRSGPLP